MTTTTNYYIKPFLRKLQSSKLRKSNKTTVNKM